jgi:hypothetical protein
MLTPYVNKMDRITLIKAAGFSPEFGTLGLRVEGFPSVFRSTPLEGHSRFSTVPATPTNYPRSLVSSPAISENKDPSSAKKPCVFYSKVCKSRFC